MSVHISRQRLYEDNSLYVELALGGKKAAGKDILTPRFPKENKTYTDPRDAVNIAVEIFKQWDKEYGDEIKRLRIVGTQTVLVFDFSTKGIIAAKAWADRMFASMEKCGSCFKPIGNREIFEHDDLANQLFCCELCVSRKYRDIYGVEPAKITSGKGKLKDKIK